MALQLSPELEQRLAALAQARHCDPMALLGELIRDAEEDEAFCEAELDEAMAELNADGGHAHDDVMGELQAILEGRAGVSPAP